MGMSDGPQPASVELMMAMAAATIMRPRLPTDRPRVTVGFEPAPAAPATVGAILLIALFIAELDRSSNVI